MAIPQLKEMSETLRGTSNKRNAGFEVRVFIKMSSPIIYIYIYIQGVPGGKGQTSGECSLC